MNLARNASDAGGKDSWRTQPYDYAPSAALVLAMSIAWATHQRLGEMAKWGVSAVALAQGRYETIALHMFAHGSLLHLFMNSLALLEIGGLATARLGGFPNGWVRLLAAYLVAGLSSMTLYLSFHPTGGTPLIGAYGAIYGLIGLLLGMRLTEDLERVSLRRLPCALWCFVRSNSWFLGFILLGALLGSFSARIAWEAHLGGFLCGLCAGPWLLPLDSMDLDE